MGRLGLPAQTARARFGKPIERWGRKASGPEQRSWIAGLPTDPKLAYTSARADLPTSLRSLANLRFSGVQRQLPDGIANSERVIDTPTSKRLKRGLHQWKL